MRPIDFETLVSNTNTTTTTSNNNNNKNMLKGETKKSKSAWEYRLEQQIKSLNQDYSKVKAFYEHAAVTRMHIDRWDRK